MTSLTIVFDNEIVSKECVENYVTALLDKGFLDSDCDRILINNQEFMNCDDIIKWRKYFKFKER